MSALTDALLALTNHVHACPYCEASAVCDERDRLEAEADRADALQEAEDLIAGRRAV
jgi:hypothetical protein